MTTNPGSQPFCPESRQNSYIIQADLSCSYQLLGDIVDFGVLCVPLCRFFLMVKKNKKPWNDYIFAKSLLFVVFISTAKGI